MNIWILTTELHIHNAVYVYSLGKLAVFREGVGKCMSTAINRTTVDVSHWINGHRFVMMPQITGVPVCVSMCMCVCECASVWVYVRKCLGMYYIIYDLEYMYALNYICNIFVFMY